MVATGDTVVQMTFAISLPLSLPWVSLLPTALSTLLWITILFPLEPLSVHSRRTRGAGIPVTPHVLMSLRRAKAKIGQKPAFEGATWPKITSLLLFLPLSLFFSSQFLTGSLRSPF